MNPSAAGLGDPPPGVTHSLSASSRLIHILEPEGGEKRPLNSELWHAHFPQGHSEQTDEVYAQMTLQPLSAEEQKETYVPIDMGVASKQPTNYFCKTLTAIDTNYFCKTLTVLRRAAEKVFPPLDFSQQPPAQELFARDIHDVEWKFRHIFRDMVRRVVGLGRYLQNPLAMVATLYGSDREILSWKLCPMQEFLTPDEKYEMIEHVMVDATNQICVNINLAAIHE